MINITYGIFVSFTKENDNIKILCYNTLVMLELMLKELVEQGYRYGLIKLCEDMFSTLVNIRVYLMKNDCDLLDIQYKKRQIPLKVTDEQIVLLA